MGAIDRRTGQELLDSMDPLTPPSALQVVLRELSFADGNGDMDKMSEIFSLDLIDHNPTFPGKSGYEGMRETLEGLRTGFSNFSHQILYIEELPDNWVVLHHEFVGSHTGEFMGFPPTGNRIAMKGTEIIHVVDGKVAETYHNEDSFGLFNGLRGSVS
jgi:predicted ester cyclase